MAPTTKAAKKKLSTFIVDCSKPVRTHAGRGGARRREETRCLRDFLGLCCFLGERRVLRRVS
jgi:hypothetical protein